MIYDFLSVNSTRQIINCKLIISLFKRMLMNNLNLNEYN